MIVDNAPDLLILSLDECSAASEQASSKGELDQIQQAIKNFKPSQWIPIPIDLRIMKCQIADTSTNISNKIRLLGTTAKAEALQKTYTIKFTTVTDEPFPWMLTNALEAIWSLSDSVPRIKFFSSNLMIFRGVLVSYRRSALSETNKQTISLTIQDTASNAEKNLDDLEFGGEFSDTSIPDAKKVN